MARILVIDDDEAFGTMFQEMLERVGHEVVFLPFPIITTEEALSDG